MTRALSLGVDLMGLDFIDDLVLSLNAAENHIHLFGGTPRLGVKVADVKSIDSAEPSLQQWSNLPNYPSTSEHLRHNFEEH